MPELGEIRKSIEINHKGTGKWIWHACPKCGKQRWIPIHRGETEYNLCLSCAKKGHVGTNHDKYGNKSTGWKGGKIKSSDGYILIAISPDDFFFSMADSHGYIREHRLIMAQYLGRCLHLWELVHHKNHIKDDNRIENLQLISDDRHTQITILENRIKKLEGKMKKQEEQIEKQSNMIRLLQWHINQINLKEVHTENGTTCFDSNEFTFRLSGEITGS